MGEVELRDGTEQPGGAAADPPPAGGPALPLSERFDLILALHDAGEPVGPSSPLAPREVPFGEIAALGHRTGQKPPLPYFFERDSAMQSAWIAEGAEGARYGFLGARSYMNNGGYLRNHVLIGRYCSIGRRVTIGAGMHGMDGLSTSPALTKRAPPGTDAARLSQRRPAVTVIESDVWIGDGAVVLPGVRLGAGCVIGANAVVTRDAVAYGVYAGAPARLIRRRFDDATCEALLASRWWDRPHDWLRRLPLGDVARVLEALAAAPPEVAALEVFAVPAV